MKIGVLHIGMKVRHPEYGVRVVTTNSEGTADILFDDTKRTIAPEAAGLEAAKPQASATGLGLPLKPFIEEALDAATPRLGSARPDSEVGKLGLRWHNGKVVLHPADPTLQTMEVPLEIFLHKIVIMLALKTPCFLGKSCVNA